MGLLTDQMNSMTLPGQFSGDILNIDVTSCTGEEISMKNADIHGHNIDLILSNHTVMQPPIVADACTRCLHSTQTHVMIPHGSALNFSVKRNDALVPYALKGIENAQYCSVVSSHAKQEFESFFSPHIPDIMHKTITIPPGVDLERFKPLGSEQEKQQRLDAVCKGVRSRVRGGRTRRQVLNFWKSAGSRDRPR